MAYINKRAKRITGKVYMEFDEAYESIISNRWNTPEKRLTKSELWNCYIYIGQQHAC